ncbi:MAG: DNA-3-methyladenine glycosylase 2 family protein [Nitrosomonas sp.]|nr:DNA-3-methyladenine glycosylase 2 family protein [Nitrosomonas sp.]MBK7363796.1 DNA-3-methyladenine glycosylase 2 family protein [Nitrosomonas sp.]
MIVANNTPQISPNFWKTAVDELREKDKILGKLISNDESEVFFSQGDAFTTLVRAIVGQQISVKAAASVWHKLTLQLTEISPYAVSSADIALLKTCGLSARKVSYIQDLSTHFLRGCYDEAQWQNMDDESLIKLLIQLRGIGRWTAEMFLIFYMLRPDVLPLDDIGLQRAVSIHYNQNQTVNKQLIKKIAQRWQPWRSVATWYLWRSLDPIPVNY